MTSSEKISFTYNQAIDLVTKELENTKIGQDAGTSITGERNIILGKDTAFNCIDINDSVRRVCRKHSRQAIGAHLGKPHRSYSFGALYL